MGYFLSLSKSMTESCLDASEFLILACGLVLAFGAAGEYLEEHERLPSWMRWTRKPRLVFVWMVAISLFGEFAGDAGVYVFSSHLQTIDDAELAAAMPRRIDEDLLASKMGKYAGTPVEFAALKEFEPLLITRAIRDALLMKAHWKTGAAPNLVWSDPGDPVPDELSRVGIWIEASSSAPESRQIAEALALALSEEGLEAHTRLPSPWNKSTSVLPPPDGTVRVYVSLKPFPGMPQDLRVVSEHR